MSTSWRRRICCSSRSGVVEGGNLDGGGGSTFVVQGTVGNTPSDGPGSPASESDGPVAPHEYSPGRFERTAVNMLAIVPRGASVPGGGGGPGSGSQPGGADGPGGLAPAAWYPAAGSSRRPTPATWPCSARARPVRVGRAAPPPCSPRARCRSTPLGSASALYKIFTLLKAKAAADALGAGAVSGETPGSTSTTSGQADHAGDGVGAGAGESAAGSAADDLPASSRLPFLVVAVLMLLSVLGAVVALHRSPSALVRMSRLRPSAGGGLS